MNVMSSMQGRGGVRTQAELETLLRSRDEFSSQLERVTEQRGRLAQERLNAEARANSSSNPALDRRLMQEYEQQISELGTRSGQLTRQIAQADEAIANAVARGVGGAETQGGGVTSTVISAPTEDFSAREALLVKRYESLMIAEAFGLILGAIFIGRIMWRRASRRATQLFASSDDVTGIKHAVDAIAVEVERISENQRYATKLLQERAEPIQRVEVPGGIPVEQRRQQR